MRPMYMSEKAYRVIESQARYKILRGGRGSGKSTAFAYGLLRLAKKYKLRVLCTREMQNSIRDSVHKLLSDSIVDLGFEDDFIIQKDVILSRMGSEFIFKGLKHNIKEIKSTQGIDICWVEEAEAVSDYSWTTLIPTIRKENSQIWVSFNPENERSPTYLRYVKNPPEDSLGAELNYTDNKYFPEVLRKEMEYDKRVDFDKYMHIWEGKCKYYSEDLIIKNFVVEEFETPIDAEFRFGADFGFSKDPSVLGRMFVTGNTLFIDYEAYGHGIEIEELPRFYDTIPDVRKWKITADSERPDTISYLNRQGFIIEGAEKGKGSVEDGIQFLRSFERIIIHPRCPKAVEDFGNYRWKRDKITNEILCIPAEGSDHWPDAARYALEAYMKHKVADVKWLGQEEDKMFEDD